MGATPIAVTAPTRSTPRAWPVAPAQGPPRPPPPAWRSPVWAPTRAARCACLPRSAAWSESGRRQGWSPAPGAGRWLGPMTPSGLWRGRVPTRAPAADVRGLRIGLVSELLGLATGVIADGVRAAAQGLEHAGAHVVPVSLPSLDGAAAIQRIVQGAAVNHAHVGWIEGQRGSTAPAGPKRLEARAPG